ncbi:MAG: beta-mannosidase [Bacteroidetes bacterium]|nr:beta-mannosidase [Bacteroidota bacterium]
MRFTQVKVLYLAFLVFLSTACSGSGDDNSVTDETAPQVSSTSPAASSESTVAGTTTISITYDEPISVLSPSYVTINGTKVAPKASGNVLSFSFTLEANTSYAVTVASPSVEDAAGNVAATYSFSFTTALGTSGFTASGFSIASSLCTPSPSSQAAKVYDFLKENFGNKVISGTMANVNYNIEEAQWVYDQTGKWPALTCIDYLHLMYSPANWIDYSDISILQNWWNNNGLVAAMWHWNVPKSEGSTDYTFGVDTQFKASNATVDGTWENTVVKADLEKISAYLLLLKNADIPVIWRPLHEASGNIYQYTGGTAWFWWGNDGADAYKKLWKYMFDYFQGKGLNNLIWVWTTETADSDFYPGDDYVDIVGCDIYPSSDVHASQSATFNKVLGITNKKMITLSECGGIPNPNLMYANGDMWSWFMPWYGDYTTSDTQNGAAYWKTIMSNSLVVTRDQMPSLK